MNQRQPATLFKRTVPLKDGGSTIIWYYYVTVNGRRRRFSLGTSSKTAARALLKEKLVTDSLLPATSSPHRFADFTTCMFLWEHCPLTARKRLRGDRISPHWVNQNRAYLVRHLLPVFGHQLLTDLTPVMIENFMFRLRDKKQLAPKTINLILSCLKAILAEAVRSTILQHNPAADVQPLRNQPRKRSILSFSEARDLLGNPDLWPHPVSYAVNLTAATTGARLGELRALQVAKFSDNRLTIDAVFRKLEGFVPDDTKTGSTGFRVIPVPQVTARVIRDLICQREDSAFIFSLDGRVPIAPNLATLDLHRALGMLGMSEEEQKQRNITFHGWRHFYNSLLRGEVTDADLRSVTGHSSSAMTEHYTHRMPERFDRFAATQERLFAPLQLASEGDMHPVH